MIRKGDLLTIHPEHRNPGEGQELYVAREDSDDRGWLRISAIDMVRYPIWPVELVLVKHVRPMGTTISFPNVIKEFPDYDLATLPPIPSGWVDSSWHNDVSPSFVIDDKWQVFVDFEDPKLREFPGQPRYCVLHIADGFDVKDLLSTNDWYAVLSLITKLQKEKEDVVQG
jgi:hypothetical protein